MIFDEPVRENGNRNSTSSYMNEKTIFRSKSEIYVSAELHSELGTWGRWESCNTPHLPLRHTPERGLRPRPVPPRPPSRARPHPPARPSRHDRGGAGDHGGGGRDCDEVRISSCPPSFSPSILDPPPGQRGPACVPPSLRGLRPRPVPPRPSHLAPARTLRPGLHGTTGEEAGTHGGEGGWDCGKVRIS